MRRLVSFLSLGLALSAGAAQAATYSSSWVDATISITYPDQVTYNTAFDVSFLVDSSTMTFYDQLAFLSQLTISNTVALGGATWTYNRDSLDPSYIRNFSGTLDDSYTGVTTTATDYQIAFIDPSVQDLAYSWLARDYNDKVTWTVQNIVILGDTTFSLKLDDTGITGGPTEFGFTVLDPPAGILATAVPEPSAYAMMLVGLAVLIVRRRQPRPAPMLHAAFA